MPLTFLLTEPGPGFYFFRVDVMKEKSMKGSFQAIFEQIKKPEDGFLTSRQEWLLCYKFSALDRIDSFLY